MRRAWWFVLLCALALAACGGEEPVRVRGDSDQRVLPDEDQGGQPDAAPAEDAADQGAPEVEPDPVELPAQVSGVETTLGVAQIKAGDPVQVSCQAVDADGAPIEVEAVAQVTVTPLAGVGQGEGALSLVPTQAGALSVTCALPSLGLIDATPARLEVLPGDPHTVIAALEERFVEAGGEVGVRCEVYDAWGNAIEGLSPQIRTDAVGAGLEVLEGRLRARRAGVYAVSCQVDGALESFADGLEVFPGPAAHFALGVSPSQEVYAPGEVVEIVSVVTDAYDNPIPGAPVSLSASPSPPRLGERRLRLEEEGTYTVTASVEGLPEGAPPLGGELSLIVNGVGPGLRCTSPANGAMLTREGDGRVTVRGSVEDAHGVSLVTVNGQRASLSQDGSFEAPLTSQFGINLVELTATDSYGVRSSRTCAFLAAEQWVGGANDYLSGGVSLRLAQSGIDDGNRSGNINSIGDLLHTALNSAQLRSQIHGALQAANPLVETYCAQDVCLPFVGCSCVYRLGVRYNNLELNGPHEVSLTLVDGGMRARATVRGLGLDVSVLGTTPVSGWVRTDSVFVDLTSDLSLQNGRPSVRLRGINEVRVGTIRTDIRGLLGWVVDLIVPLFEGLIRNQVQTQIRNFISGSFNSILDGTVSGLDISSLGTTVAVPSLSGGSINLGFGVNFSSLNVNGGRALFGIGTRFTGPSNRGRGRGVPLPPGGALRDPQTGRAIAATVHQGVLNHALHTLWVAGMFDADLGGATLGAPGDVSIGLRTGLPPVLTFVNGKALLSLGAATVTLVWPGFLDEALTLEVGARAEASVTLQGEELRFGQVRVTELALSSPDVPLDPVVEAILEDLVRRLVQRVVDQSLNDALPALPIPSFAIPDSLSQYGLPRGTSLGLRSPQLQLADPHVVLESDFGAVAR